MPRRPKGEGGRPPEQSKDDTDPEKTGVSKTGVSETGVEPITQDVEGVEIDDETLASVPPDAERTSVRPRTGELSELDLPEEDESDEPHLVKLDQAQARALSKSGAEDERDEQTDPGREQQTIKGGGDKQRRMKFGKLWDELAALAGKEIEREEFARFEERQKAGEDIDALLGELLQNVTQRRALAATADLPADQVVGQGDDTLEDQARKQLRREIRRTRSGAKPAPAAEEETLDPSATQVVRQRQTPRRPESTEIIPPKPKPKPKKPSWLEKLKFWKK